MTVSIKRVILIYAVELLILVIVSLVGFYVGPLFISQSMVASLQNQLESTVKLGPSSIFLHNLAIDTLMAIPVIGPFFFVFALVTTGFVLGIYIAYAVNSIIVLIVALLVTMFLPHGIIELLAYAFSTAGSLTFTRNLINSLRGRRRIGRSEVIALIIYYLISVVLLYIAANVEYFEITALKSLIRVMIG
ncbi:stage II sporulation protein M [Vulcanisaeta sp. JCM 16159]|uniref:stage II sporulation protein M n=1 Tax=Vulcanisaeta sp. JCM 16159 TaxID=1295371 RepID=UPI0006D185F0|nr:stage II sporulation protein M [Vulcanisaeta sp. JCM 16159]